MTQGGLTTRVRAGAAAWHLASMLDQVLLMFSVYVKPKLVTLTETGMPILHHKLALVCVCVCAYV